MTATGGGRFHGTIPGQPAETVVHFYVEGTDGRSEVSRYPARGPDARALYKVDDGQADLERLHNLRIVMTPADTDLLHLVTNVMSNEFLGATAIYDEKRAFYDVGVRLRGSERGRANASRVGFTIRFHPDDRFRGIHRTVSIDRSGGRHWGRAFGQDEILVWHIVNHAGGIPGMYDDIVRVIAPRRAHTSSALLMMAKFNDLFLESQFENGAEGMLYTYELIYYPTSSSGGVEGLKLPQPDSVIGQDIRDLGDDKESYRWFFLIENNRDRDDYARLMEFCKAFAAPLPELEARVQEVMDVEEWMRTFAMYALCGIGDTYAQGLEHNNKHYVRPRDNKVLVFPYDMDFAFTRSSSSGLWGDRNLARIITRPAFTRMYFRHLQDILDSTFDPAYLDPWVKHYGDLCGQNFGSLATYIRQRSQYVRQRVSANIPFEITTADGADFSVDEEQTVIEGSAPFRIVDDIRLNGKPAGHEWHRSTRWRVTVPLASGPNDLEFAGYDADGNEVGRDRVRVTSTVDYHPPAVFMVTPAEGPRAGGTEVTLFGENFAPQARVRFGSHEAPQVTVLSPVQLTTLSPPGAGQVTITVENPDGLSGTAPVPFTYLGPDSRFRRGDTTADGRINVADAVTVLLYLFASGAMPCRDAADVNDDGAVAVDDAVHLLTYLFLQGDQPAAPFVGCGADETPDDLDCVSHAACDG
jgi:hypothetical protein